MRLVLFRSNNIFDSRVNKYHNYFERAGLDYTIVGWDRKGEGIKKKSYYFFQYLAGEDVGGLKAIRNHFKWMLFVYRYLKQNKDVTTIHACDLNSAFPAALYKSLRNRKVQLIFDACDWYSAIFAKYTILNILIKRMEHFTYVHSDELIICEPERKAQIQFKLKKEPMVMPNIPEIDMSQITDLQDKYIFDNVHPTLAYMGGFADGRFLMELLTLAETEPFNLLIAGYGEKEYIHKCQINTLENVRFFGRVNMTDGLNMENAADVVYAMYCKINPNNIFAAPNKYYEAMMLGKPLITTKGTIPGDKVEIYDTGWAIEEDIEELRRLVNNLDKLEVTRKGKNAKALWESCYKDYLRQFFDESYSKIIK